MPIFPDRLEVIAIRLEALLSFQIFKECSFIPAVGHPKLPELRSGVPPHKVGVESTWFHPKTPCCNNERKIQGLHVHGAWPRTIFHVHVLHVGAWCMNPMSQILLQRGPRHPRRVRRESVPRRGTRLGEAQRRGAPGPMSSHSSDASDASHPGDGGFHMDQGGDEE